jgi:phosphoribosylglycinamide formyltransferase 1
VSSKRRVGVLISGRGSNMMALVEAAKNADFPAEIALVVSNKPDAAGITYARDNGVRSAVVIDRGFPTREQFEKALDQTLRDAHVEIVCLAGFMRILTPWFVERWMGRMINIHPSLLPAYKGLHTHERALADGVRIHGCSVHFVVPELDAGPIIAQAAVPVEPGDDAGALAARVLQQEHRIYPAALGWLASGAVKLADGRCQQRLESGLPALTAPRI